jgi:4-amino-4-deoxy-L-arabinose transferase-like glycosyltransferase
MAGLLRIPVAIQVALLVGGALIPAIFLPELVGSSEAREAHIALDIAWHGNWVSPTRVEEVASKPPLSHWISAMFIRAFDMRPLYAQRVVSLLFAMLLVSVTSLTARLVIRDDPKLRHYERSGALLAAFGLSTSYLFVKLATSARVDMAFSALVMSSFYFFYRSQLHSQLSQEQSRIPLSFFICAGLAVLAKGPLGIVLPALTVLSALFIASGMRAAISSVMLQPGWMIAIGIPLIWYGCVALSGGSGIIERQIVFENIHRFFGGEGIKADPFWYYLPSYLSRGAPWSFIFIPLTGGWLLRKRAHRAGKTVLLRQIIFALVVTVVFLSVSSGKRHAYLLPILPLMIIALTQFALHWYDRQSDRLQGGIVYAGLSARYIVLALCALFLAIISVASLLITDPKFVQSEKVYFSLVWLRQSSVTIQVWLLLISLVLVLGSTGFPAKETRFKLSWCGSLALFGLCIATGVGMKSFLRGHYWVANTIDHAVPGREAIHVLADPQDEELDPIVYYLVESKRRVQSLPTLNSEKGAGFYIASGADFDELKRIGRLCDHQGVPMLHLRLSKVKDFSNERFDRDAVLYQCERSTTVVHESS